MFCCRGLDETGRPFHGELRVAKMIAKEACFAGSKRSTPYVGRLFVGLTKLELVTTCSPTSIAACSVMPSLFHFEFVSRAELIDSHGYIPRS